MDCEVKFRRFAHLHRAIFKITIYYRSVVPSLTRAHIRLSIQVNASSRLDCSTCVALMRSAAYHLKAALQKNTRYSDIVLSGYFALIQ